MYKISHEVINYTEKIMKAWRVELTAGGRRLAETKIQSDIFQGEITITVTIHKCHDATKPHTNDTHKLLWEFNIQTDHLIPARRPDLIIINKKKRIYKIMDFAVPSDHRINLKECAKKDQYLDLARELKKLWNMKVK